MDIVGQMTVFTHVVEAQGFTAAARKLGLSRSAISKHISELESRLGARLFNRSTRQIRLTADGAMFYERCTHILSELAEAEAAFGRAEDEPQGTVRVGAPAALGRYFIVPSLPELAARFPKLGFELTFADPAPELVSDGLDIALRLTPRDPEVGGRALGEIAQTCVAASSMEHPPALPAELVGHSCLGGPDCANARQQTWRFEKNGQAHNVRVRGSFQSNSFDAVRAAALAGMGVARLPCFMVADDIAAGRLVELLSDFTAPTLAIIAERAKAPTMPPRIGAVLEHLERLFPQPSDSQTPGSRTPGSQKRESQKRGTTNRRGKPKLHG